IEPRGSRLAGAGRALLAAPLRYAMLATGVLAAVAFAVLLWPARRLPWHVRRRVDGMPVRRP
ncbi:hypothetical protein, partial [Novilysobacter arseniciresistens]|uniref:hypothetical protein n=1 Tax=Novilysobacter arseniciresistens TaxID=1385522 RepID=UPI00056A30A4